MHRQTLISILFVQIFVATIAVSCNNPQPLTADATGPDSVQPNIDSLAQISEYVVSAFEDSKGNLWFGTMSDGAVKFDGKAFTYITTKDGLIQNTVAGITQDTAGNYWFGTHAGASRYDGKTYTSFSVKEGLRGSGCKFLVDKTGALWAATYDGVFKFNGKSFTEFVLPSPQVDAQSYKFKTGAVWCIMEDFKGNIWFGRDTYGACKYDGKNYTHYTKADGLCSNNVSRVVEDLQGNIWFSCLSSDFPAVTKDGGVCKMDGDSITQFPDQPGLTNNDIYMIYCERSGKVWISAGGVGVYRYDAGTFTLFTDTDRKDLIPKYYVQSILEDSKGNFWFGFSGGLFRFKGNSFVNVTQKGPW